MTDLIPDGVTRLLLVEGPDDKQFFKRLVSHMQREGDALYDLNRFKIRKYRGKNKLREYIYELLQRPNYKYVDRIWIVRDIDYNSKDSEREIGAPKRALQSVNSAISNAYEESSKDFDAPVLQDFNSPTEGQPSLSLMVLPDSNPAAQGSLETLLLRALEDDPMMSCVGKYFDCVKRLYQTSEVAVSREDKSRLGVLLSGKLILRDLARSKDATRELPRYMYHMKWWDDSVFGDPVFDDAKTFLHHLLAD